MTAIVTAYCACAACCGAEEQLTAAGNVPVVGITVAAPRNIPFGTRVRITLRDGRTWTLTAQDRTHTRYDGRWDIFLGSHADARAFGIHSAQIDFLPGVHATQTTRRQRSAGRDEPKLTLPNIAAPAAGLVRGQAAQFPVRSKLIGASAGTRSERQPAASKSPDSRQAPRRVSTVTASTITRLRTSSPGAKN